SAGLEPPDSGCEWQDKHWLELNRGPIPLFAPFITLSTSANRAIPSTKNAVSSAVNPFNGPPTPADPPRTPGSTGPTLVFAAIFGSAFSFVCPNAPPLNVNANAIITTPRKPAHTTSQTLFTVSSTGWGTQIVHLVIYLPIRKTAHSPQQKT